MRFILILISSLIIFLSCSTEPTPVYQVQTSAEPEEAGEVSPVTAEVEEGDSLQVEATPNEHWLFDSWSGDYSGSDNPTTVVADGDKEVTALFVKREYPLTIQKEGEGSVTEEIVQEKTTEYEAGTTVQLTAEAEDGWSFSHWEGDLEGDDNPQTIEIYDEKEVTAVFERVEYTLTVQIEGEGEVSEEIIQAAKGTDYPYETEVELTANPSDGWSFSHWEGDLDSEENPETIQILDEKNVTAIFELLDDSDPQVSISVDWNELEGQLSDNSNEKSAYSETGESITHFGARLVYVKENAVFTQSVERTDEEDQEIITMEVPPAEEAFLMVTAVNYGETDEALLFGTIEEVQLQHGTQYDWSVENIDWIVPEWTVIDSLAEDYENGVLTANKDDDDFELIIHVTEPFYPLFQKVSSNVNYDENIIKINGSGGMHDYDEDNGMRDFRFIFENPDVGTENVEFYGNAFPRLDSQMFNLPSVRYVVDKKIEMEISWE